MKFDPRVPALNCHPSFWFSPLIVSLFLKMVLSHVPPLLVLFFKFFSVDFHPELRYTKERVPMLPLVSLKGS